MRKMTSSSGSVADRTRYAFRECIRTIDSFAAGNVIHEYIVKAIGGLGTSSPLDMDSLDVLLRVVDTLRNPNPADRTYAQKAIGSLLSLASTLPKDPRGEAGEKVRSEVRSLL
jgi:hypothetical protein